MLREPYAINVTTDISLKPRLRRIINRLSQRRCAEASTIEDALRIGADLAQDLHTAMDLMDVEGAIQITILRRGTFETHDYFITSEEIRLRRPDSPSDVFEWDLIPILDDYTADTHG